MFLFSIRFVRSTLFSHFISFPHVDLLKKPLSSESVSNWILFLSSPFLRSFHPCLVACLHVSFICFDTLFAFSSSVSAFRHPFLFSPLVQRAPRPPISYLPSPQNHPPFLPISFFPSYSCHTNPFVFFLRYGFKAELVLFSVFFLWIFFTIPFFFSLSPTFSSRRRLSSDPPFFSPPRQELSSCLDTSHFLLPCALPSILTRTVPLSPQSFLADCSACDPLPFHALS